jgi:hypothetical protein
MVGITWSGVVLFVVFHPPFSFYIVLGFLDHFLFLYSNRFSWNLLSLSFSFTSLFFTFQSPWWELGRQLNILAFPQRYLYTLDFCTLPGAIETRPELFV